MERAIKAKVIHHMADGTIRDSIKGVVVPGDNPVYDILKKIGKEDMESVTEIESKEAC